MAGHSLDFTAVGLPLAALLVRLLMFDECYMRHVVYPNCGALGGAMDSGWDVINGIACCLLGAIM